MAFKSGNPALNKNTFKHFEIAADGNVMTLDGVAGKSLLLLLLCVGTGAFGWNLAAQKNEMIGIYLMVSLLSALVVGLITVFKKKLSPYTAPLYAVLEGFVLGVISQLFEASYSGIVLQALLLTGGIFVSMLFLYLFRIIKATENFKLGVAAATGGIALYYIANLIINFFGKDLPLINSTSGWGIGFTVLVIIVAALNLVVDFDFIEQGVEAKAPKYMEWYSSFGLFVTLVWLYLEILRLLGKVRSR
jgi:uncharacterized YccA/Bax inhibitor family protein